MYVVIAGDSLFALQIATELVLKKNKVVVVIKDKDKATEVSGEKGLIVVNGSAIKPEILDTLDLEHCDVFVAATYIEEVNILSALYAKDAGAKRIFVMTTKPETELILKKLGVKAINPEIDAALNVELHISRPAVADLVGLGVGEYDLVEIEVNQFLNLLGKEIGQIYGRFFTILSLYKGSEHYLMPNTPIEENATLIMLCEAGKEKELDRALKDFTKEKIATSSHK